MKAKSSNFYPNYYNIEEIITKFQIPVEIIEVENFGYSEGQWLKAYEIFKDEFDYYLYLEDDYCPNIDKFDKLLIDCYNKKFKNNIGLLCSLVEGNKNYNLKNKKYPIHWEGSVFISTNTLNKLYETSKWNGTPREYLDKIDVSIDNKYNWKGQRSSYLGGYYQVTFSHLFTLSGIEHEDYLDIYYKGCLLQFPYWSDIAGKIRFYDKGDIIRKNYNLEDIFNSPIIPVQLHDMKCITYNTTILKKLV